MRIKQSIATLNYEDTKEFFKKRAGKFKENNPYSVTMYQDNNEKIVQERNQKEIAKLKPLLQLNPASKVLDVACGIGRWADAIEEDIQEYCGVDFSGELITIANQRNHKQNYTFYEGSILDIENILAKNHKGIFNVVLMIGILMYINDDDLIPVMEQIINRCEANATVCIREPIGVTERLTLKNFFSDELKDTYNAIYRTREELTACFEKTFLKHGFVIEKEGFMFEDKELNNRKETEQYFYTFRRKQ